MMSHNGRDEVAETWSDEPFTCVCAMLLIGIAWPLLLPLEFGYLVCWLLFERERP